MNDSVTTVSDYQQLSAEEHVHKRPDMYFGNKNAMTEDYNGPPVLLYNSSGIHELPLDTSDYYPGVVTLLSELIVNSFDSAASDPLSKKLNKSGSAVVEVSVDGCEFSIVNYGSGMPTGPSETSEEPIPQMCFGSFYSGSNFNDDDDSATKFGGGRNGFGAAIVNVMSDKFSVEVVHKPSKTKYEQVWKGDTLDNRSDPKITQLKKSPRRGYVRVTSCLNLSYFFGRPVESLGEQHESVLRFRLMCASYSSGIHSSMNGEAVGTNLPELCSLGQAVFSDIAKQKKDVRMRVSWWYDPTGTAKKIGIVNGVFTPLGTHMTYATSVIWDLIRSQLPKEKASKRKSSGGGLGQSTVMRHVGMVVSVLLPRPEFSSNGKEKLVTPRRSFGFTWKISRKVSQEFTSSEPMTALLDLVAAAQRLASSSKMTTKKRRKVMISIADKLVDAKSAGKKNNRAFLMLTEGDSAASLVHAGRASLPGDVGQKNCGSMVLRGKMLNVRNVSLKRMMENKEIRDIVGALGLVPMKAYASREEVLADLRYHAGVVILSDQDTDGSHIAGLVCNTLEVMFPSVFKLLPNFVRRFVTPVVICTRGSNSRQFYSLQDFESWRKATSDSARYTVDYYKGLATSSDAQARRYFSNFYAHILNLRFGSFGDGDGWESSAHKALDFAFSSQKDMQALRKDWILQGYDAEASIAYNSTGTPTSVDVQDFVRTDVAHFWNDDNRRSIPHLLDGLKESQRKAVFVLLTEYLKKGSKLTTIERMANRIAEVSSYHHGSKSMEETITRLVQDWVGAPFQNLPLMQRAAQFGSRWDPAKVHGASRYLRSLPHALLPLVFPPVDLPLLDKQLVDGVGCEPVYFVPVIPFALVNGLDGIGTGFSSHVPPHDPLALIHLLIGGLESGQSSFGSAHGLVPFVYGFSGDLLDEESGYVFRGRAQFGPRNSICITELPMVPINNFLASIKKKHEKAKPGTLLGDLTKVTNRCTMHQVDIQLDLASDHSGENLASVLSLDNKKLASYKNMYLWDESGDLRRVDDIGEVIDAHAVRRLALYGVRKEQLLKEARHRLGVLRMKCRFAEHVIGGSLRFHPCKTHEELVEYLDANGFEKLVDDKYDFLLSIPMTSLTRRVVNRNESKIVELEQEVESLEAMTPESMWLSELRALESGLLSYRTQQTKERKKPRK